MNKDPEYFKRWYADNKEALSRRRKERRKTDPEYRQKTVQWSRDSNQRTKERRVDKTLLCYYCGCACTCSPSASNPSKFACPTCKALPYVARSVIRSNRLYGYNRCRLCQVAVCELETMLLCRRCNAARCSDWQRKKREKPNE